MIKQFVKCYEKLVFPDQWINTMIKHGWKVVSIVSHNNNLIVLYEKEVNEK